MKIKISILLTFVVICSTLVSMGIAVADTSNMDSSYVLDDLQGSTIAGTPFSPDNFGYSSEKEVTMLSFAEFGFPANTSQMGDFGLYIYVYNPTGKSVRNTLLNKISIATTYDANYTPTDFEKFALDLLSVSTGQYANLFLKFKVIGSDKIFARVAQNTNLRRYDIAELELNFGEPTSEAFLVGNYFEYRGFAKGYGIDKDSESTLTVVSDDIQTLRLDVKNTYYRYNNSVNVQSNMNSVYFGVPEATLQRYGTLQQIKANWFETHTEQMLVLDDFTFYNSLLPYVGISVKENPFDLSALQTGFGCSVISLQGGRMTTEERFDELIHHYKFNFTGKYALEGDGFTHNFAEWEAGNAGYCPDKIHWLFYGGENGYIPTSAVTEFAKNYTEHIGGELILDKYSSELFVPEVDVGRQYGWQGIDGQGIIIDANSKFDINGFTTGSNFLDWFKKLFNPQLSFDNLTGITPIYVVSDTDLLGTDDTIAEKLLIDSNDIAEFKSTYAQNKLEGKKTVIFRFAVTDYYTNDLGGSVSGSVLGAPESFGYVAEQTAFLDFDIIWLKFVNESQQTIIPVVSNPVDVFSALTPPLVATEWNILAILLAAIIVILIFVCIYKLLTVRR